MKKFIKVFSFVFVIASMLMSMSSCIKIEKESPAVTSSQAPVTSSQSPANSGGVEIKSFQASPLSIKQGDSVTLAWDVTGADKVSISPEVGPVNTSGIVTVKPQSTTTFKLEAQGPGGSADRSVTAG